MISKLRDKFSKYKLHPTMLFIYLSLGVIILSGILSLFNVQISYEILNTVTSSLDSYLVEVENLISISGLQYVFSSTISNFTNFSPLVMLLTMLIGVGICEKVGLFRLWFEKLYKKIPREVVTFIFCLLCMILGFDQDLGYVLMIPLGAILFSSGNRSSLVGIVCAFVMVSAGSSVSLFATSSDYNLNIYTEAFSKMLDSDYSIALSGNTYISIAAILLISLIGTFITERIINRKLDRYKPEIEAIELISEKNKRKGYRYANIAIIVYTLFIIYSVIPGLPLSGMLLDSSQSLYVNKLFGVSSMFSQGIVFIISLGFFLAGLFYGIGSKQINDSREFIRILSSAYNNIGNIVIMMFFASVFISLLKKSKIGTIIVVALVNLTETLNFSSILLVLLVFVIVLLANTFVTSGVAKWSILSTVVVPLFLKSNLSPEFAQVVFKFANSATLQLTPVFIYFVLFLAYIEKYSKGIREFSLKNSYSLLMPYTFAIATGYLLLLIIWYVVGLPLGPGVFPTV